MKTLLAFIAMTQIAFAHHEGASGSHGMENGVVAAVILSMAILALVHSVKSKKKR